MAQYRMKRGTTFVLRVTFYRGVDNLNNPKPIDLSGPNAKVWFTAKKSYNEPDPGEIQVSSPTNIAIVLPGVQGTVIIAVPAAMTVGFPAQDVSLYYDIKIRENDGRISVPEDGNLIVGPTATNAI